MHTVIISRNLPPAICGIADHSILFGDALRTAGHRVTLVGGHGEPGPNQCIVKEFWQDGRLGELMQRLQGLNAKHLVLQYTPLTFAIDGRYQNFPLAEFWSACSRKWKTSLILHESYFRAWWHPPSLIRGTIEKVLMKRMVRESRRVFTASQPLYEEIGRWPGGGSVRLLPLGSHLPLAAIDRERKRAELGIGPEDFVLTLFGGGESVRRMRRYVQSVDALLSSASIAARWLFLGQIPRKSFSLVLPVISPGYLPSEDLSATLQVADIFLMPHVSGLSAKRSTLMAALQHGLPVAGTRGSMTDQFWDDEAGIILTPMPGARQFAETVLELSRSGARRHEMGEANRTYFDRHCRWDDIAGRFLEDGD